MGAPNHNSLLCALFWFCIVSVVILDHFGPSQLEPPEIQNRQPVLIAVEGSKTRAERSRSIQNLIEPLSKRELEVLRLLPSHLSTPEMAEKLMVAVSTVVRSHVKSIYGKLNVHSRYEAIERARELKLLYRHSDNLFASK